MVEGLRSAGYRVLEAAHVEAALALLNDYKDPVDLLFADVVVPGMNGANWPDC